MYGMKGLNAANAVLRFVLELCMLAAFAYWGSQATHSTPANVALAIATPVAAAVIWGIWLAPRSDRRLPERRRLPLEIVLFGLATAALAATGQAPLAIAFGAAAAINTALVHLLPEI
jgi:hypothetical protein